MQRAFSYARKIAQKRYRLELKDAGTISVELPDGIYPGIPWIVGVGEQWLKDGRYGIADFLSEYSDGATIESGAFGNTFRTRDGKVVGL